MQHNTKSVWSALSKFYHWTIAIFDIPHFYPADKELADIPYVMHIYIGWVAAVLLLIHIGASLLHHFYYKDNILRRMLPAMLVMQDVQDQD